MRQAPTEDQIFKILHSLERPRRSTDTDRAIALVGANLVDHSLKLAILSHFIELGDDEAERLFGAFSPLGTLAAKISVAHALAIIRDDERDALAVIRNVRNAFAHMALHVSFRTPAVVAECGKLWKRDKEWKRRAAKEKFMTAVGFYSGVLSGHAQARVELDARPKKTVVLGEP